MNLLNAPDSSRNVLFVHLYLFLLVVSLLTLICLHVWHLAEQIVQEFTSWKV